MDATLINSRISEFNAEMQRLASEGDGRDLLAWTGEQLAVAAEELRNAPEGDRTALALYVMYVARPHISCLYDADMPVDALATSLMVLMTCLLSKANPEEMPVGYVAYLQNLFVLATALANDHRILAVDTDGHLARIAAMLGALATATVKVMENYGLPRNFIETDAAIREDLSSLAPSELSFGGKPIEATMALDIAADAVARLKALDPEIV